MAELTGTKPTITEVTASWTPTTLTIITKVKDYTCDPGIDPHKFDITFTPPPLNTRPYNFTSDTDLTDLQVIITNPLPSPISLYSIDTFPEQRIEIELKNDSSTTYTNDLQFTFTCTTGDNIPWLSYTPNVRYRDSRVDANNVTFCLLGNTKVLTPEGYKQISDLKVGEEIISSDNRILPIIEITHSSCPPIQNFFPYIIPKNYIDIGVPNTDIRLSYHHKFLNKNIWIQPSELKDLKQDETINNKIEYYNIRLPNPKNDHLVINGGLIVESIQD
jgi:hypothetical protein